jgi:hypothetical protein
MRTFVYSELKNTYGSEAESIILDSEKFLLIVECLNYPNPTITAILILVKQNS